MPVIHEGILCPQRDPDRRHDLHLCRGACSAVISDHRHKCLLHKPHGDNNEKSKDARNQHELLEGVQVSERIAMLTGVRVCALSGCPYRGRRAGSLD